MVHGIGGDHVNDCVESDFKNNLSKRDLHKHHFEFKEITSEVLRNNIIIIIMFYSAHVVVYIGFLNSQISVVFLVSFY